MSYPEHPKDKPLTHPKAQRAALALKLDRAAHDLNPILVVLAIGLMLLNIVLYLGMMASREPFVWSAPIQTRAANTPAPAPAAAPATAVVPSDPLSFGR
jgi:hypothetical protein